MSNVLLHGATGMIGNAVAQSLVRSGNHNVWGLARTEEKGRALAAIEITPVICPDPINDPKAWLEIIHSARIDTVIDAAGYYDGSLKVLEEIKKAGSRRISTANEENFVLPQKLGYIYISGAWVHGDSMKAISDLDPVGVPSAPRPPVELAKARPELEQAVLKSRDTLDVAVVRPVIVYGNNSWIFNPVFEPIYKANGASSVQIPNIETAWPSFVHVDDVADGVHAVVNRLQLLNSGSVYPVFDLASTQENLSEIIKGAAKALGYQGKLDFVGPGENPFLKATTTSTNADSSRARILLGWEPKKVGMMRKIETYAMAWKANQEASAKK